MKVLSLALIALTLTLLAHGGTVEAPQDFDCETDLECELKYNAFNN